MLAVDLSNYFADLSESNKKGQRGLITVSNKFTSAKENSFNKVKEGGQKNFKIEEFHTQSNLPPKLALKAPTKSMTFSEALWPKFCLKQHGSKHLLDDCEEVLKKKISLEYFLQVMAEFENLKQILLDEDQLYVFKYLRFPSLEEHLENMKLEYKFGFDFDKLEGIVNQMRSNQQHISKSIIKMMGL